MIKELLIKWDATNNLVKPVYEDVKLFRIQTCGFIDTKKMILLKQKV